MFTSGIDYTEPDTIKLADQQFQKTHEFVPHLVFQPSNHPSTATFSDPIGSNLPSGLMHMYSPGAKCQTS